MKPLYSQIVGYSSLSEVDREKMRQVIQVNRRIIDHYHQVDLDGRILVAGTGSGCEARLVHEEFHRFTLGVDLNVQTGRFDLKSNEVACFLSNQDLSALGLHADAFSLIYCYHVLEHVNDHRQALAELSRVLKPGGALFIGFPNKKRWFAYIGTSQKASAIEKIKWNLNDLKFRLQHRFENRYGAHAGFSQKEFISDASAFFSKIVPVREQYMTLKYPKLRRFIKIITKIGLSDVFFPSNYFICFKESGWK